MKRFACLMLLIGLLVTACSAQGADAQCNAGICIQLSVSGPVQALVPIPFVVTVRTDKDLNGVGVSVSSLSGVTFQNDYQSPANAKLAYQDETLTTWTLNTQGGVDYTFSGSLVLGKPTVSYGVAYYTVLAAAIQPSSIRVTDDVGFYLDAAGNQVTDQKVIDQAATQFVVPTSLPDLTIVPETPYPTLTPVPPLPETERPETPQDAYPAPQDAATASSADRGQVTQTATPAGYPGP